MKVLFVAIYGPKFVKFWNTVLCSFQCHSPITCFVTKIVAVGLEVIKMNDQNLTFLGPNVFQGRTPKFYGSLLA